MNELECQGLIVDAVCEAGGRALKLNNRFLVGVVDLLVKLPQVQPFWLEAKFMRLAQKTVDGTNHVWDLGVTAKQKEFLRQWGKTTAGEFSNRPGAGMLTGVVSFLEVRGKTSGIKGLRMALFTFHDCDINEWRACVTDHEWIGDHGDRMLNIADRLEDFARGK